MLWIAEGSPNSAWNARVVPPRSKLATTEAASRGVPSWKRTPSRSVNDHDTPSFVIRHDDARTGVMRDVAGSTPTSVSKTWRVATSEAMSFDGSREATSEATATRSVPPEVADVDVGVVGTLGFSVHAPSTTQIATRTAAEERIRRGTSSADRPSGRLEPRVESIAESVADEVQTQHGQEDHRAGRHDEPRRARRVTLRVRQHVPPARSRRRHSEAEIAESRFRENDRADVDCGQNEDERQDIGE